MFKKFFGEFREFAVKGNVVDLAVGVIIGGAFKSISTSIVEDIFMPFIGLFIGGINLTKWVVQIPNFIYKSEPIALNVGNFLMTIIDFIIIALVVFMIVKAMNAVKRKKGEEKPAVPVLSKEEVLLTEIRDLLAQNNK